MNPGSPGPVEQAPVRLPETVQLAHGGGGVHMHRLLESIVMPAFANAALEARHDGAVLTWPDARHRLAFTTDSYVVQPWRFPGGDIGRLAVHGTVNDLAMCGARPLWLSVGLILEEGLPFDTLRHVVASMQACARACGVQIVTGDTKVVDQGKGDGLYVNTAGIGVVEHDRRISPDGVRAGDAVLVNGDLGRHGIAVMAVRNGLQFETSIESDTASLWEPVAALLAAGLDVHCLRDLTRGGLASALVEIAAASGLEIGLQEPDIPVAAEVHAACEILGFDPMYVANEGRMVCFLPEAQAGPALEILRRHPAGAEARRIGTVGAGRAGQVTLRTRIGATRLVEMLSGEQLPRIC